MEINRNHYFIVGIIVLLLGIQLRAVHTYELNEQTTQFLAKRSGKTQAAGNLLFTSAQMTGARKTIEPPEWIGWMLVSIGSVLILHSLAMKKPGG